MLSWLTLTWLLFFSGVISRADDKAPFDEGRIGMVMEKKATGKLQVGMASVDIDPTWPEYIPYGKREKIDVFYGGPSYAKAVVLRIGDMSIAWVELDVIGLHIHAADFIKRAIASETGLPREHIILAATHNHSYPRVREDRIRDWLAGKSAQAVKQALGRLFEARMGVGHRVLRSDLVNNREKIDGPSITDLYVMRFDDAEGMPKGVLFNFAAHSTMFTKSWSPQRPGMIGPDWPGYVRDHIEGWAKLERLYSVYSVSRDAPTEFFTMFAQGACGDQIGLGQGTTVEELDGALKSPREILVKTLARNVIGMIPEIETTSDVEMVFRWKIVAVPLKEGIPEKYRKKRPPATILQALILNDTVISTFPGELVAELGLKLQRHSGFRNTLIVGYANDSVGYIVSEAEALEAGTYAGRGSAFGPDRGRIITNEAIALANPDYRPDPPFDRSVFGGIRGKVDYDGKSNLVVAAMDLPRGPDYGATNWGKRAFVAEDGSYRIEKLLPGRKFLYVAETGKKTAALKRWEGDQRLLTFGSPALVRAGRVTEGVDFHLRVGRLETEVKAIRMDESAFAVMGSMISGQVLIEGELDSAERIVGGLYPFGVSYRNDVLRWAHPTVSAEVERSGDFAFRAVPPGRYRVGFRLDVNENGLTEPGIDVVSGLSKTILTVE